MHSSCNSSAHRAAAAEKEAAAKRATEAQVLEDAGRLVSAWNERQAKRMPMLFSPMLLSDRRTSSANGACGRQARHESAGIRLLIADHG